MQISVGGRLCCRGVGRSLTVSLCDEWVLLIGPNVPPSERYQEALSYSLDVKSQLRRHAVKRRICSNEGRGRSSSRYRWKCSKSKQQPFPLYHFRFMHTNGCLPWGFGLGVAKLAMHTGCGGGLTAFAVPTPALSQVSVYLRSYFNIPAFLPCLAPTIRCADVKHAEHMRPPKLKDSPTSSFKQLFRRALGKGKSDRSAVVSTSSSSHPSPSTPPITADSASDNMPRYIVTVVAGMSTPRPVLAVPFDEDADVSDFVQELEWRIPRQGIEIAPGTSIVLHLDSESGAVVDADDMLSDIVDPKNDTLFAVLKETQKNGDGGSAEDTGKVSLRLSSLPRLPFC